LYIREQTTNDAHERTKQENERMKGTIFSLENEIERYKNLNTLNEAKVLKLEEHYDSKQVNFEREVFVIY